MQLNFSPGIFKKLQNLQVFLYNLHTLKDECNGLLLQGYFNALINMLKEPQKNLLCAFNLFSRDLWQALKTLMLQLKHGAILHTL